MKLNRQLTAVAYLVAALMLVMPMLEVVLSVWPLRMGETSWRFGTVGLLSQALMTPLLGALVLVIVAVTLNHRKTLATASGVALLLTLALLVVIPIFALDAIQMRTQVRTDAHRAFDLSSLLAAITLSAAFVSTLLLAIGSWKMGKSLKRRAPAAEAEAPLLAARKA